MLNAERVIGTEWSLLIIALIFVATRMVVRISLKQQQLLLSDIWLLAASVAAIGVVICDTITYHFGAMSDFNVVRPALGKVRFVENFIFDVGLYLPKFSMLTLYFKLIPITLPGLRTMTYIVTGFTAASALVTLFADIFWCGLNVSVNWSTEPDSCTAFTSMTLVRINWSTNITTEALIFIIPFFLLRTLNIGHKREAAGISVIFGLGVVTLAVSSARFTAMVYLDNNISIYILATTEFCTALIVVSLTALRPLFSKVARIISSNLSQRQSERQPGDTEGYARRTGPFSNNNTNTHRSFMNGFKRDRLRLSDSNGSIKDSTSDEVQLHTMKYGVIYKTEEFAITSTENTSPGSRALNDGEVSKVSSNGTTDVFAQSYHGECQGPPVVPRAGT